MSPSVTSTWFFKIPPSMGALPLPWVVYAVAGQPFQGRNFPNIQLKPPLRPFPLPLSLLLWEQDPTLPGCLLWSCSGLSPGCPQAVLSPHCHLSPGWNVEGTLRDGDTRTPWDGARGRGRAVGGEQDNLLTAGPGRGLGHRGRGRGSPGLPQAGTVARWDRGWGQAGLDGDVREWAGLGGLGVPPHEDSGSEWEGLRVPQAQGVGDRQGQWLEGFWRYIHVGTVARGGSGGATGRDCGSGRVWRCGDGQGQWLGGSEVLLALPLPAWPEG